MEEELPKSFEGTLFKTNPKEYADSYTVHLIEQYKLYVQSHEKISERRQETNKFFLTLNTLLLGGAGYVLDAKSELEFLILIGLGVGVLICYFWYRIIRSYDGLNTGKFTVLHAVESRLPLALYDTEWEVLGRGEDPNKYLPLTKIEKNIPALFVFAYVLLIYAEAIMQATKAFSFLH